MPTDSVAALEEHGYEVLEERPPGGLMGRVVVTTRHLLGVFFGGLSAYVREQRERGQRWTMGLLLLRLLLAPAWLFMDRDLMRQPFSVQFRRRLEMLGPTYIKLGQILSLREDLLPAVITTELQEHLLDQLPAVPIERFVELIEDDLGRPVDAMFAWVQPVPLGSASLAQTHAAGLHSGEAVVLKVLKPWVRETVQRDTLLMRIVGITIQPFLRRYQPKRLIDEFCAYTLREVDLRFEADSAETFAANFQDQPDIRFPTVYRRYSNRDVLCMEFFDGHKPDSAFIAGLDSNKRDRVIDLGIQAITQMIFRDGFFHADLHPGNVVIFEDATVGFIDLGMVGRFGSETRTRMLDYLYALVNGNAADAARYLTSITIAGIGSDPDGFRRAVDDLNRRWLAAPPFRRFSLAQLLLQSVALAGQYRIQYPGEIVLMAKALVTVEGMARMVDPDMDIVGASRKHVRGILLRQFDVAGLVRDSVVVLPELIEALRRSPLVFSETLRFMEGRLKTQQAGPLAELRGTIFAGFALLAGSVVVAVGGPWPVWVLLFGVAFVVAGATWVSHR